jgi:sugar phosphate isomerase/epimerase
MFAYFTSSVMFAEQPFEVACASIAQVGLREVDIWSIRGWCEHIPPDADEPDWGPIREALDRHSLTCHGCSLYGAPAERLRQRLPQMRALGGRVVVTGSASPDVSVAAFAERIRPIADLALDLGATLAIENHGHATIDSIASMVELCDRIDHDGLGVALAPIHVHNRGEKTEDAICALGHRIALFYAWDWGPTANANWKDPQEQIPGKGVLPFAPMLDALHATHYSRPLCIFAHGVEHRPVEYGIAALHEAIGYLRAVEKLAAGRTP